MGWSILLSAVCGGLAAGLAGLLVRDRANRRGIYFAVLLCSFAAFNFALKPFLLTQLQVWQARQQTEKLLAGNRLFSLLAAKHPEIRDEALAMMSDLARREVPQAEAEAQALAWGRSVSMKYFPEYLPAASDASLVEFASANLAALDHLSARSDDGCAFYLYGGTAPPGFQFNEDDSQKLSAAMADIVASSSSGVLAPADPAQKEEARRALIGRITAEHGPDFLAPLARARQPDPPDVDRRALCNITRELYRTALDFPEDQRAVILRALLARGG